MFYTTVSNHNHNSMFSLLARQLQAYRFPKLLHAFPLMQPTYGGEQISADRALYLLKHTAQRNRAKVARVLRTDTSILVGG